MKNDARLSDGQHSNTERERGGERGREREREGERAKPTDKVFMTRERRHYTYRLLPDGGPVLCVSMFVVVM